MLRSEDPLPGVARNICGIPLASVVELNSWTKLANGMGVEAARAETMEECADLMACSFRQPGPFLIELMTSK